MKLLLTLIIFFTQSLLAIGAIDIKNLNLSYFHGAGSAEFDSLHLRLGSFDLNIDHLHHIDLDYENNKYHITQHFDGDSKVDFIWKLKEGTKMFQDINNNISIQTQEPINLRLGTRKSSVDIPSFGFSTNDDTAFLAKNVSLECNYSRGTNSPTNYMVNVLKACLVHSRINVQELLSEQKEKEKPIISEEFDDFLSNVKHPLAKRTGVDLDKHKTTSKRKRVIDQLKVNIDDGLAQITTKIKVWEIPLNIYFKGPIALLEKQRQVRVNIQEFKILGVNFSDVLVRLIESYLKKYDSKAIRVDYPYVYLNVESLYVNDN